MDYQLKNKSVLVTASTAGIGFAIAKLLAAEDATVFINGRTEERVQKALADIHALHPLAKLQGIAADLSTSKGLDKLFNEVNKIDILINNLGIYEVKPFLEIEDESWQKLFDTNVMSGVRLSRHYLPHMLKNNWGRIIFISSESGLQIPAEMIHYGMTKTAQLSVARGLAEITAGTGITVNSVLPGPTSSEGVASFIENMAAETHKSAAEIEKEFFATVRPTSLLKRFTSCEEVAALVAYLASPISSGTTGAAMRVDGGVVKAIV